MKKSCSVVLATAAVALALACGSHEEETTATTTPAATPTTPPPTPDAGGAPKREIDPEKLARRNADAQLKQGELPQGFPEDLHYPGSEAKTSMLVHGSGMVMLSSDKPIADVLSHYREELPSKGWTVDSVKESKDGTRVSIKAHKESQTTTLSISQGQGGVGTDIGIALNLSS